MQREGVDGVRGRRRGRLRMREREREMKVGEKVSEG